MKVLFGLALVFFAIMGICMIPVVGCLALIGIALMPIYCVLISFDMLNTFGEYKDDRISRYKLFENFLKEGKEKFQEFSKEEGKWRKFKDYNFLNICPGSRNGGVNKRIFEVFYGTSFYAKEMKVQPNFSISENLLMEKGTTLSFAMSDDGFVSVILYPSKTEYTSRIEEAIFLKNRVHPNKLQNKQFLKSCWNKLNLYMENTSINGNPSYWERLKLEWLLMRKNLVVNGVYQDRRIYTITMRILEFVMTVGCSGFVVSLFLDK